MKVLALSPGYKPLPSGAYMSLHETLKFLQKNNIQSTVLTLSDNPGLIKNFPDRRADEVIDGIAIIKCKSKDYIPKLKEIMPDYDLVFLQVINRFQQLGIENMDAILNKSGKKWLYMQRSAPTVDFAACDFIIANSKWSAAQYTTLYKHKPENIFVLTPPVHNFSCHENTQRHFITIINPIQRKGGITFCNLARLFPKQSFLAQLAYGKAVSCLQKYPNITISEPTENMQAIYDQTCILLVPSLTEPFGRVALEGALSGCLILASYLEGLKEVPLLPEFYIRENNLRNWEIKLKELLSLDKQATERLREKSLHKAGSYKPDWNNLLSFLEKIAFF